MRTCQIRWAVCSNQRNEAHAHCSVPRFPPNSQLPPTRRGLLVAELGRDHAERLHHMRQIVQLEHGGGARPAAHPFGEVAEELIERDAAVVGGEDG